MMLPSGVITATTSAGGSPYQQMLRGTQSGTFAGAHMLTAANQAAAGGDDMARDMMQQVNTAGRQQAVAALNFQDGAPDNEVRNHLHQQKRAANELLQRYKGAFVASGALQMPHMVELGRRLGGMA
jgi:hypothetical protein